MQNTESLLARLLNILNKIWTQTDWKDTYTQYKYCLTDLFANDEFTLSVHLLAKSFEKELTNNRLVVSHGRHSSVYSWPPPELMLHLILRVNGYHQHIVFVAGCWQAKKML
jgi:hypothetical protein